MKKQSNLSIAQQGLSAEEAKKKLGQFGLNEIVDRHKKRKWQIFFEQFQNFLTVLLVVAAIISFVTGEVIDSILIITIVVLNGLFGYYQEVKAEEAISALKKMTVATIRVFRDGEQKEIESRFIVPGDVIFVEEGVKVPADARILEAVSMEVNESALTGESLPIAKAPDEHIYMGTIIAKGRAYAKVISTGMETKFGKIASEISTIEDTKTPLQRKLGVLSKVIGVLGISISLLVFVISLIQGQGTFPSFLLAVSLAVAAVPEALPAVTTITLAIGVKNMAKRKAVMRRLSAIEALGSVTVIATDKTGTLTKNEMQVAKAFLDLKEHQNKGLAHVHEESLRLLLLNSILCSTANLDTKEGKDIVLGDPTEGALLYLAEQYKQDIAWTRDSWTLVEEIPFNSEKKRMSVKVKQKNEAFTFTKGAPESVLTLTKQILLEGKVLDMTEGHRKSIQGMMDTWSEEGLRVLAFSYKPTTSDGETKQIFLGMVAIHDPPRPEVAQAMKRAHKAGIRVLMITGDNKKTAETIARHTGLMKAGDTIIEGSEIDSLTDEELLELLPNVAGFARVTPFHKSRIVTLLQKNGEIVAVTGDGVNDAIALKQADVGVAMGKVGTDVARETADMVILDDNFVTIVNAIEEGRNIIKNLKNAIKYLLATNVCEILAITVGLSIGIEHVLYPIQILYINLVTDGLPVIAMAFAPRFTALMKMQPDRNLKIIQRPDFFYIISTGVVAAGITLLTYWHFGKQSEALAITAAFSVIEMIQSFIFIDLWLSRKLIFKEYKRLFAGMFVFAFTVPFMTQFLILQIPFVAKIFKSVPVSIGTYATFIGIASLIFVYITLVNVIREYRKPRNN